MLEAWAGGVGWGYRGDGSLNVLRGDVLGHRVQQLLDIWLKWPHILKFEWPNLKESLLVP